MISWQICLIWFRGYLFYWIAEPCCSPNKLIYKSCCPATWDLVVTEIVLLPRFDFANELWHNMPSESVLYLTFTLRRRNKCEPVLNLFVLRIRRSMLCCTFQLWIHYQICDAPQEVSDSSSLNCAQYLNNWVGQQNATQSQLIGISVCFNSKVACMYCPSISRLAVNIDLQNSIRYLYQHKESACLEAPEYVIAHTCNLPWNLRRACQNLWLALPCQEALWYSQWTYTNNTKFR